MAVFIICSRIEVALTGLRAAEITLAAPERGCSVSRLAISMFYSKKGPFMNPRNKAGFTYTLAGFGIDVAYGSFGMPV